MEMKRYVTAIVLSCLVFVGWNYLSIYMGWAPADVPAVYNSTLESSANATAAPSATDPAAPAASLGAESEQSFMPADAATITVSTPLYEAVFYRDGGVLKDFFLLKYRLHKDKADEFVSLVSAKAEQQAPLALLVNGEPSWKGTNWTLETTSEGKNLGLAAGQSGTLVFTGVVNGFKVRRELGFSGDNYLITETAVVDSASPKKVNIAFTVAGAPLAVEESPGLFAQLKYSLFGGTPPVAEESTYNQTRVAWVKGTKFDETSSLSDLTAGTLVPDSVSWMGVMNNYFMGMVSVPGGDAIAKGAYVNGVFTALVGKTNLLSSPEKGASLSCTYMLGPKEAKVLETAPNQLDKALDYGMFSFVAKPLLLLLSFFYGFLGNYGYAIIFMTIVIRILLWPLSHKSFKSMEGMRKIQPIMAEIRERHAGDKEAMNKEIMAAYKRYKVNPAGGCLPIFLQLPIFIGLYQALLNSIELRHASFIANLPFTDLPWLGDLSAPDPYFITPLVMGATMVLQQKMSPPPGDPTQAKIMMFMPVMFTFIFLGFPSGLVLYWLVSNTLAIAQQWWQMKQRKA